MNLITLIVGRSGSGKTTLVNELENRYGFKSVHSYTTRPKRSENEIGHIFVSSDKVPPKEEMVAYTVFNGYEYWATQGQIEGSDLYVIDPDGIKSFMDNYKGNKKVRILNILVAPSECFYRMIRRGDTPDKALERIKYDDDIFSDVVADAHIVNSDLNATIKNAYYIIQDWEKQAKEGDKTE